MDKKYMNICIYTVNVYLYARITRYSKLNLAFPITVHFIFLMLPQIHKNTKYLQWKNKLLVEILSLLLAKDFNQHHIWYFPLPCTGKTFPWTPHHPLQWWLWCPHIKSNQITFIVTSPQHKCLGEWNTYERAPDSAEKQNNNLHMDSTYLQTVQKTMCTIHILSTHSVL